MFSFFSKVTAGNIGTAYDYEFKSIDGDLIKLSEYKNKIIVVVNVASRCGYTPQYEGLQELWSQYKSKNLVVLGIPTNNFRQEPGNNKEINHFFLFVSETFRVLKLRLLAFPGGPGGFRELREASRNHIHLSWYLLVTGITSYDRTSWGGNFLPSTVCFQVREKV